MNNYVTYCSVCGDGFSDEQFMFGVCCGEKLLTRPETAEEKERREVAEQRILKQAKELGW